MLLLLSWIKLFIWLFFDMLRAYQPLHQRPTVQSFLVLDGNRCWHADVEILFARARCSTIVWLVLKKKMERIFHGSLQELHVFIWNYTCLLWCTAPVWTLQRWSGWACWPAEHGMRKLMMSSWASVPGVQALCRTVDQRAEFYFKPQCVHASSLLCLFSFA